MGLWKWCLPFGVLFTLGLLSFFAIATIDGFIYFEKEYYFKLWAMAFVILCLLLVDFQQWSFHRVDLLLFVYSCYLALNGLKTHQGDEAINHLLLFLIYFLTRQLLGAGRHVRELFVLLFLLIALLYGGHGLLQYCHVLPRSGMSSAISGYYSNSAPFAALLVITVPLSLSFLLAAENQEQEFRFPNVFQVLHWSVLLVGSVTIALTASRAALFALVVAVSFTVAVYSPIGPCMWRRRSLLWGAGILVVMLLGLYGLRPASANGRLLIWRIALSEMVVDQPLTGGGEGYFQDHYMHYQGEYLAGVDPDSRTRFGQLVANTPYAFNEFIRMAVDDGLVGVGLFLAVVVVVLSMHRRSPHLESPWNRGLQSCLLGAMAFAFFSYPFHDLTFRVLWMLVLAGLGSQWQPESAPNGYLSWKVPSPLIRVCGEIVLIVAVLSVPILFRKYNSYSQWRSLHPQPQDPAAFRLLANDIGKEGLFTIDYAAAMAEANQLEAAVEMLEESKSYSSHPVIYLRLGLYYEQLANYKLAKRHYQLVCDMLPYKFYPLHRLMILQFRQGDKQGAISVAREILTMPVKVPSATIDQIKVSAKKCLQSTYSEKINVTINPPTL